MVKQRLPQSVSESREAKFVEQVEKDNLQSLTLNELANRFEEIEQQGQLLQGRILLEARHRFKSDNEFGAWIESVGGAIYSTSRQHRTKLMNLARFFEGREIDKISISAAYEISAPVNADIAVEVYEFARGKNLPLAEVRRQIALKKGVPNTSIVPTSGGERVEKIVKNKHIEIETISTELVNDSTNLEDKITALIDAEIKNPTTAIELLKDLIDKYQKRFGY